jgi:hypothetical protein
MQAYFACAFGAFEPAVNLATAILQDPTCAHARQLDDYVQEAMSMLERMCSVNKVAVEGLETLVAMRAAYLERMDVKGPSPGSSASLQSTSDPSPSLYASSGPSPLDNSLSSSADGQQTLTGPRIPADNAATPNTLFNQFFGQYPTAASSGKQSQPQPSVADTNQDIVNLDQLFNFDATMFSKDPTASWLTEPMAGGLDVWPTTYHRLEGESSLEDWSKVLGF